MLRIATEIRFQAKRSSSGSKKFGTAGFLPALEVSDHLHANLAGKRRW